MARTRNSSKAPAKKNSQKEKPVKRLGNKNGEVVKNASVVDNDSKAEEWTGRKIVKVSINHCKSWQVFKKRAAENITRIASSPYAIEKMESELNNSTEPIKRGSFEIIVTDENEQSENIWSGLKLGPPRRLKFPEEAELFNCIKKFLQK